MKAKDQETVDDTTLVACEVCKRGIRPRDARVIEETDNGEDEYYETFLCNECYEREQHDAKGNIHKEYLND